MAPHSSTLAWKIPWTEEPGRLQSMGPRRVGHDWATSLSLFTFMHWRGKWQPTPVFLPGESQGWWSLVGCRLRGCTESDTTEVTQQQQQQCVIWASLVGQMVKNLPAMHKTWFDPWVRKIPWRREWQPTPVFRPGEFYGQRSLAGYSPSHKELDMTERLTFSLFSPLFKAYIPENAFIYSLLMYMFESIGLISWSSLLVELLE